MAELNRTYILWIVLVSLLSPCIKSGSCPTRDFYNWLGVKYQVSSTEKCTSTFGSLCVTSTCSPSPGVYTAAQISSGWTLPACYSYEVGSSGSDDMKCSNPNPDPVHEAIFLDVCKIHDLCLKTDGRSKSKCNDEFYHNMKQKCKMAFPDVDTAAHLGICLTAASAWKDAVNLPSPTGAKHRGGIDPDECKPPKPPGTLVVYCDNKCDVYRSQRVNSPWGQKTKIGSASNWKKPLTITVDDITQSTTIFVQATDTGTVGGFMGCIWFNNLSGNLKLSCTKPQGLWKVVSGGTGTMTGTKRGYGSWGNRMSPSSGISPDAYWLWAKDTTNNVMIFRFQFKDVLGGDAQPIGDVDGNNDDNPIEEYPLDYNDYYMPQPEGWINIKPAPVFVKTPSNPSPSYVFEVKIPNQSTVLLGMLVILSLSVCLVYGTCCYRKKYEYEYASVKYVDSENEALNV